VNLVSLAFTAAAIVAMLGAVNAVAVTPLLLSPVGLAGMTEEIVRFARWPALTAAMLLGLSVLYRYGPSRRAANRDYDVDVDVCDRCTIRGRSSILK
jgi:membrane protein